MSDPVTAKSGWRWFLEAVTAIRKQPLALTGIVVFYILVSGLLSGLPAIGTLLTSLWMPFGCVLVGFATRDALRGVHPSYVTLVKTFEKPALRMTLMWIGLISALYMEVLIMAVSFLSKDSLSKWVITEDSVDLSSVLNNFPTAAVIVGILLYVPLLMMTLFAPLLAADGAQSFGKSFFYSFFGLCRHWVAALVGLLTIVGITALTGFLLNSIF
ncbi:transmembrane protein [gut metagenome]|uniref:Transmembrane protein n=1 Tax=gut metagenome TaxID=749906 RepID=J9GZZ1_9ZZZZ